MDTTPAPRILTIIGKPFPKVQVLSVDPTSGTLTFRWLDTFSKPVDSGNSIARFAPVGPVPAVPPATTPTYPEPTDATLTAAVTAL